MNSKYNPSQPFAEESVYEYPTDSCNHLISTSLKHLNEQYQNLSPEILNPTDFNKKKSVTISQEEISD